MGVTIFTSAIGLGYRTDKGLTPPKSWKDLADSKLAGQRGSYLIPVNSLGQCHLMMLGKVYGKGLQDLDAAYKALEQLKPIKLVDFTGQMEKMMLSSEVTECVIHDSGMLKYEGATAQPFEFCGPSEGVLALEQVLNVTPGSKVKELAFAYIDFLLRPDNQEDAGRSGVVFAGQQEGEARGQVRRQAADHAGEGGNPDPARLEVVQRAQGRHRRPRHQAAEGLVSSASIKLDEVTKTFDGKVVAVDGVTLDIRAGEFFSLLGPSGCGKTTRSCA